MAASKGPEFDAAMKVLIEQGKPAGRLRTWWCSECRQFRVLTGTEGCSTCVYYVVRVEV